jgi:hypothetical protein
MLYYIINYNIIYSNILYNIINFCKRFEIDFESQKIKNKKELTIYYSILQLLLELEKNKLEKPIIIYERIENNNIIEYCLNKISKILVIPIYICDKFNNSEGMNKELSLFADTFYEKNTFNVKRLKKLLVGSNFNLLLEKIKKIKLLAISH